MTTQGKLTISKLLVVCVITKARTLAELLTQQPCETWKQPESVGPCARGLNLRRRPTSFSIQVQVLNHLNTSKLTPRPILTNCRGKGKREMLERKGGDAPRIDCSSPHPKWHEESTEIPKRCTNFSCMSDPNTCMEVRIC